MHSEFLKTGRRGALMKVVTVVGARPQFIKAAVVSHVLRKKHTEILVHTGQHFDHNMSELFFEEMHIPAPDYNLGISGGSHAQMTGRMMSAIEEVLQKESPDWMLTYGDTNSTLAAALASSKLHIPVCHVEAGVRLHNLENPEEINRVCTDHVGTLLLSATQRGFEELKKENLGERSRFVGDPMFDAFRIYSEKIDVHKIQLQLLAGNVIFVPDKFYYLTCHREENTKDDEKLLEILRALDQLDAPTIYPVHPRNKERALRLTQKYNICRVLLAEPVGYLESTCLVRHAKKIVTDSGGLQREAFFAGTKCVTVFGVPIWPETMVEHRNDLSKPRSADILEKLALKQRIDENYQPFGDSYSAEKIVQAMEKTYKEKCL